MPMGMSFRGIVAAARDEVAGAADNLLKEDGDALLLENSDNIELNNSTIAGLTESGDIAGTEHLAVVQSTTTFKVDLSVLRTYLRS